MTIIDFILSNIFFIKRYKISSYNDKLVIYVVLYTIMMSETAESWRLHL